MLGLTSYNILNKEMALGNLGTTNFSLTVLVWIIVSSFLIEMRLKAAMETGDCRPSRNFSSETEFSSFIMPYEKIRLEGIVTEKPLTFGWLELKHRLPLIIVSKVILIFFEPADLILKIPLNLLEKSGCQFPTFWLDSIYST
jgi:hypothetical protein